MRIRILSDLHREFGKVDLPDVVADVVVLVQRDRSSTPMDIGMVIALITRLGVVSEPVSSELHILWHRRNHVAHGMSAELTNADAEEFRRRADRIIEALSSA
jgi:hypothetical protein